jgi:chromosomal replication initiator protein
MDKIKEFWNEIIETVKKEHELTSVSFETWLKPLKPYCIKNNELYILVPSEQQMAQDYIQRKYSLPIKVAIEEITGLAYNVKFVLQEQLPEIKSEKETSYNNSVSSKRDSSDTLNLNPNYTFDTFVVGSNNRFAHSASLAVAESPGEVYNPLFIYGGVGLGKTHLMQSIAHFIKEKNPSATVRYVSSETFTNELIESIRNGNSNAVSKFREKYRNIDVLLIDDIQFIIGKESTQEEFFHTFNELHTAKKQIIISSDKPPKDMQILEDRIRTRLEWGLIADIGSPDYETRMAILKRKEEMDHFFLEEEILKYIASNVTSNIRELEGALNKLQAYSNLEKTDITMEIAVRELRNIISPEVPAEITPEFIIKTVCDHFNVSREDINSSKRNADIAYPRQIIMYLCRHMCDINLKTIGDLIGKRDHSTVMHGISKIEKELEINSNTRSLIDSLQKKIKPE